VNSLSRSSVTISEVAAMAHVSMTTVSRFLNGKYEYMSAETRRHIAEVIEKTGYHPSNIARSLKARSSRLIGCVIADISSQFSSILLKGVNAVCRANGYQVLFADAANDPAKERAAIQQFLDSRVDGLIVNTTGGNDSFLIDLSRNGLPIVLADRRLEHGGVLDTVSAENRRSVRTCISHLQKQGYEKAAFFTPGNGSISPRVERCGAFLGAMRDFYGLNGRTLVCETEDSTPQASLKALQQYRASYPGERLAVFCVNGVALLRLLEGMRLGGIPVSPELGVCGFDDWEWAELIPPGITTIAKDSETIGRRAAELLIRRMKGETGEPEEIELECRLRVRGSTDPALAARKVALSPALPTASAWRSPPRLARRSHHRFQ
jgi:LacI family kdg operon repressor